MKTVKIISGTYGHRKQGSKSVTPVHMGSTVELSEDEAKRLVERKVAVYVEEAESSIYEPAAPTAEPVTPTGEPAESDGEPATSVVADYNADTPFAELKELFKLCGLSYRVGMSRNDMLEILDEYFADDEDDTGEAPPQLSAEELVE